MAMGTRELERLQDLIAEARGTAITRPVAGMQKPPLLGRRRWGGLDLLAATAALYAMIVHTPVGGIVVHALSELLGKEIRTKPLIAYFQTPGAPVDGPARKLVGKGAGRLAMARKLGVDPTLGHAVAFVMADGQKTPTGEFEVRLPRSVYATFPAVGVKAPAPTAPAIVRQRRLLEAIRKLEDRYGHSEAAVAATVVGLTHVDYAVGRAKAAAVKEPAVYDAFRAYLPPEMRGEADPIVNSTFALVTIHSMRWPVDDKYAVSSPFGMRDHPVLRRRKMHNGTDIALPRGTPIFAATSGVVLHASRDTVNGNFVKVDHGFGISTTYCHLSKNGAEKGARLEHGDLVGHSGSTGRVTGPHLHYEIKIDGEAVDPEQFR